MGHSIALNAAWMGINTILYGISEEELNQALQEIDKKLETLMENSLINKEDITNIRDRIKITTSLSKATEDSTFIIEAVTENILIKKEIYKNIEEYTSKETIIASNTSGLLPSDLAADMKNPERMLVTHFWNPAHLIPLVEVVGNNKTNDKTIERSINLLNLMKKKPILVRKEILGFVGNRLQYALFREAQFLLEQGIATIEDIDSAVNNSIGRRLPITGPFLSADMGGLDVFVTISDYLFKHLSDANESFPTINKLVDNNKYGYKSGEGFYKWDNEFSKTISNQREKELIHFLKNDFDVENEC